MWITRKRSMLFGIKVVVVYILLVALSKIGQLEIFHEGQENTLDENNVAFKNIIKDVKNSTFNRKNPTIKSKNDGVTTVKNPLNDALVKEILNKNKALMETLKSVHDTLLKSKSPEFRSVLDKVRKTLHMLHEVPKLPAKTPKSPVVCPEKYVKATHGYPFFDKGWDITTCTGIPKFSEVLSIAINMVHKDSGFTQSRLKPMLFKIAQNYSGLTVHIASVHSIPEQKLAGLMLDVHFHSKKFDPNVPGQIWNYLVKQVKTPYVLIARDLDLFSGLDARLERLVRQVESLEVDYVGAASRNLKGHWSMNCLQATMKNYTLIYESGYHMSQEECVYCDVINGPFVSKVETLKANLFDETMKPEVVFHDFFLSQRSKTSGVVVCPDSMFYNDQNSTTEPLQGPWLQIAKKYVLLNIKIPNGRVLKFSCSELNLLGCQKDRGLALNPCCLQNHADMVKFFMRTCAKYGLICEFQEGTLLSAVKLGKVLPWERDADLTILSANFTEWDSLKTEFDQAGYSWSKSSSTWCCVENRTAGGTGILSNGNWHAEIYGMHLTDTEKLSWESLPPTKILYDGMWASVPRNPGMFARNRYGHEIYKHAQHWMTLGHSTGWDLYNPQKFSPCPIPGAHNCLDKYSVDGNLQFTGPEL